MSIALGLIRPDPRMVMSSRFQSSLALSQQWTTTSDIIEWLGLFSLFVLLVRR